MVATPPLGRHDEPEPSKTIGPVRITIGRLMAAVAFAGALFALGKALSNFLLVLIVPIVGGISTVPAFILTRAMIVGPLKWITKTPAVYEGPLFVVSWLICYPICCWLSGPVIAFFMDR